MSINVSTKKIGSVIFFVNLVSALIVLIWLYLLDSFVYVPLVGSVFWAVYLISLVIVSDEYASYFRKYSLIYKVILGVAFTFLIITFLARPTYYLATFYIGLFGFDFTLAILMAIIHDQKKIQKSSINT